MITDKPRVSFSIPVAVFCGDSAMGVIGTIGAIGAIGRVGEVSILLWSPGPL
jgi:hypothetical protein